MRQGIFILAGMAACLSARAATREAAYGQLRDEAHVSSLVVGVAEDIKDKRYGDALKKADAALKLAPDNAPAINARGAALMMLGRFDESQKMLDAAIDADPKAFPPQYNLGEVLMLQKKYADAAVQFNSMLLRFGEMPVIKYNIYLCNALRGSKDEAQAAFDTIRYPMDGPAWYYANAVEKLLSGKRREALRLIALAGAIHKDDVQTYDDSLRDCGLLK